MENLQLTKYKAGFKKECLLKVIASALAVLTLILFVVIPFLQVKISGKVIYTFSLFEEMKNSVKILTSGTKMSSSDYEAVRQMLNIYHIFAMVYFIIALIILCVGIIKNAMSIINVDNYALETYDRIKKGDVKAKGFRRINAEQFMICAILFEVMYIFFVKIMIKSIGSSAEFLLEDSKMALLTGVSASIIVVILFLAAYIVVTIMQKRLYNKLKIEILKEDYGVTNNQDKA